MDIQEWRQGRQIWAPVIGRLLLAFGEIEYCLMIILGPLGGHQAWERLKNSEFKKKISESIRVLDDNYVGHRAHKQTVRLLNESIKLATYRNLVAHNPLNVGPFSQDGEIYFRLVIVSLKNHEKYVAFSELNEVAESSEYVALQLHELVHELWTSDDC
jgi:hypothetical protein